MRSHLLLVSILLTLITVACSENKSRPYLLIESGFENNKPFRGWIRDQHCCDYSFTQSAARATDGAHSIRVEVRSTDPAISGSIRSELVQEVDEPVTERWYGFNMYLEDWADDVAGESAFEWHPDNEKRVSAVSLWVSGGRYVIQTDPGGINSGSEYADIGPILNNQWVSWVIHVKWATDNTGLLQIWKNDSLKVDRNNITTCSPHGVYFKIGLNKFGWGNQPSAVTKRVLYYDEIRIGDERAKYENVKPSHK